MQEESSPSKRRVTAVGSYNRHGISCNGSGPSCPINDQRHGNALQDQDDMNLNTLAAVTACMRQRPWLDGGTNG